VGRRPNGCPTTATVPEGAAGPRQDHAQPIEAAVVLTERAWVITRYFDAFNKARRDRWVFGDRRSGAYLHKFAWTRIVRHQIVKGGASPDDPALTEYWTSRRRKAPLPIDNTSLRLLKVQEGRCPICEDMLLAVDDRPQSPREWEHQPDPTPCRNLCAFEHAAFAAARTSRACRHSPPFVRGRLVDGPVCWRRSMSKTACSPSA
jgi:hypothetical protein